MKPSDEIVLILAPTGRDAKLAQDSLQGAGFLTYVCRDIVDLCEKILKGAGAALIAEEALSAKKIDQLLEVLGNQPAWSDFPILIFTSIGEENQERLQADDMLGRLGNITLLERPVRIKTMLSAMNSVLRARHRQYQVRDLLGQIRGFNEALEKRVNERTAAYKDVSDQMEAFAYSVSHDLRAPLRAIHSFSDILLNSHAGQLDEEGMDFLKRILKSAKFMDSLTQDLLAYSRLSRAEFALQRVSLDECITDVLYQMSADIDQKKAKVIVARPLPEVLGHVAPIEQILCNLLSNALKFSRPETPIHISIKAEDGKEKVRLSVEDNGIGVPSEHHERIFRLFERLAPKDIYPGTGMGLAIVKKAAERMGGCVGVESNKGQGSRFWFELPKAPVEKALRESPRELVTA